jgi:uncharacterized membrane protein (DUF485 family)
MPAGGAPGEGEGAFDWWAAPGQRVVRPAEPGDLADATDLAQPAEPEALEPEALEPEPEQQVEAEREPEPDPLPQETAAAVYRHVQAGEEFQEVRRAYRSFVFPACAAFLAWYLLYIVAAVTLPGLMDHQVAGPFNVAWVLGLLQFASTFLIAWLYARHARDRRDRMALGLRWETQDRLR